jgi:hypothetical protein
MPEQWSPALCCVFVFSYFPGRLPHSIHLQPIQAAPEDEDAEDGGGAEVARILPLSISLLLIRSVIQSVVSRPLHCHVRVQVFDMIEEAFYQEESNPFKHDAKNSARNMTTFLQKGHECAKQGQELLVGLMYAGVRALRISDVSSAFQGRVAVVDFSDFSMLQTDLVDRWSG